MLRRIFFTGCALLATGCASPRPGIVWEAEFEYFRRGGLCATPDGGGEVCQLSVTVRDDGTWSAVGLEVSEGTLVASVASELGLIFTQSMVHFTLFPFTGVCPTAYDGQEYGYRFREIPTGPGAELMDARVTEISSCLFDLESEQSIIRRNMIEEAWKAVRPPELDGVEFR